MNKSAFLILALFATSSYALEATIELQIQSMYEKRLERFQTAPTPAARADAYVADIVENAVWLPQNAPPLRGREAVRKWSSDFFTRWTLEIDSCEYEPMIIDEKIAVRRFTCSGTYIDRDDGRRIPFSQKYVDVLQMQPDRTWKLESHMWSSNDKQASIWSE
jgi:ketosteroid isomerase-like protein